jgi:alpha 1,6-mannosyltransferase
MEHTGPGIWTDAVLAYLKARYNVTWHELRGLQRPLRIGEVLILPITGQFSP